MITLQQCNAKYEAFIKATDAAKDLDAKKLASCYKFLGWAIKEMHKEFNQHRAELFMSSVKHAYDKLGIKEA